MRWRKQVEHLTPMNPAVTFGVDRWDGKARAMYLSINGQMSYLTAHAARVLGQQLIDAAEEIGGDG